MLRQIAAVRGGTLEKNNEQIIKDAYRDTFGMSDTASEQDTPPTGAGKEEG